MARQPREYDVIIVGLGSGGGTMANRLVKAGWRVLALEAGIDMPTPADRRRQHTQVSADEELLTDWHFYADSERTGYGVDTPQNDQSMGRMVGGSSHHFGMVCYRGTPEDYDEWDHFLRAGGGRLTGSLVFDGTPNVRGAGTRFDREVAAGDYIRLDAGGQPYRVAAIQSATLLRIEDPQGLGIPAGSGAGTRVTPWNRASILQAYRAVERDLDFGSDPAHSDSGDQHIGRLGGATPGDFGDTRPNVRTSRILPIAADAVASLVGSHAAPGLPFEYVDDRNSWDVRPNNAFFKIPLNYVGWDSRGHPVVGGQQTGGMTHLNKYDERRSTLLECIDPIRGRPNFTLIAECTVNRLLFERSGSGLRARGVEYLRRTSSITSGTGTNGATRLETAHAPNVILSAGPYGTPAILLRSGVGAHDRLAPHGIGQVHDLPGVGANMSQHTSSGIGFRTKVDLPNLFQGLVFGGTFRSTRNLAGIGKFEVGSPGMLFDDGPDCVYFLSAGRNDLGFAGVDRLGYGLAYKRRVRDLYKRSFSLSAGVYKPRSRGDGVRLRSLDPGEEPVIRQGVFNDPDAKDAEAALEALQAAAAALLDPSQPFFRDWVDPAVRPVVPARVEDIIRTAGAALHAVSTCRMGPDSDPFAVCDERGRVRGIRGLRICDNSIMPTPVRANPHLPTCAHSHLIAAMILADGEA
jgi:choline dehydrogenase-like flavoprotein